MTGSGSAYIVRAPRLLAADDARAVLAEAERAAARVCEEARADAERTRTRAEAEAAELFEAARSRGRDEAAREAAALLAEASSALDRFWREREAEMGDLALAVARRILSSLPEDDLLLKLAREAVAEHGRDARLALKVSSDMADRLRAALDGTGTGGHVSVSADPSLAPGECALLHPRGRTEIGLLAQFRALMGGLVPGGGAA